VSRGKEAPISFDDLICSTLATLRLDESVATGLRLTVDTAGFLDQAQRNSSLNPNLNK